MSIKNYLNKLDWRIKENSNTGFSLQGLNNYISSDITKQYWLNTIYTPEIKQAHEGGTFHIHDLNLLSVYCMGWDLQDLLKVGFKGVEGKVASSPAKHLSSILGQIINFIYTLTGEAAGAMAFSNFDTLLAPFIRFDHLSYKEVKQALQEFIFNMNIPTRVGFQTPFSNISLDLYVPVTLKDVPIIIGGEEKNYTYRHFQAEMNIFNKAFAEVMIEGDASGRPFTFPIPNINITKDFDWDNPNFEPIWKMTSKYGIPYFSNFVNSDMKTEDCRSFCCRLRLDNRELRKRGGALFGANPLTGSIGVVTINMSRIGYVASCEDEFFDILQYNMRVAIDSLIIKRATLEDFANKNLYPYTNFYLRNIKNNSGQYWKNHFSTIGLIGMNEACLNLFGDNIGSLLGRVFAIKVLDFMRGILADTQEATGDIWNLEATPGEGCIVAESLVKTINGDIPICELIGKETGVYTYDEKNHCVCIKKAYNIRKTRKKTEVIRIIFDNDTFIDLTPDHEIAAWEEAGKITWTEAKKLEINKSIRSLYTIINEDGRVFLNSDYKRARLHYEYFHNIKLDKNTVIHHINQNPNDDSKENLQLLTKSQHNKIHYNLQKWQHKKGECFGKDNPFWGKNHTEITKIKISKARKNQCVGENNPTKRPEIRKKLSDIAKSKPEHLHSKWREDISTKTLIKLFKSGKTHRYIAECFNCTKGLVQSRLKKAQLNHKVKKIICLEKKQDVYNMEVKDTECFFINDGILIHNCSYSLALKDKKKYPNIIVANEKEYQQKQEPYLTNSTQLPVNYTDDLFEALELQDCLQTKYTGGTASHIFLGEQITDIEALKSLIKKVATNFKLPYFTITPTFSICPSHGYLNGEQETCPTCNRKTEIYTRSVGYLRPISAMNKGKQAEVKNRTMFKVE